MRAVGYPAMDLMGPVGMAGLGTIADEPVARMPVTEHSMLLDDPSDELIDRLTCVAGADSGSPLAVLQIRRLGGALLRHGEAHGSTTRSSTIGSSGLTDPDDRVAPGLALAGREC